MNEAAIEPLHSFDAFQARLRLVIAKIAWTGYG